MAPSVRNGNLPDFLQAIRTNHHPSSVPRAPSLSIGNHVAGRLYCVDVGRSVVPVESADPGTPTRSARRLACSGLYQRPAAAVEAAAPSQCLVNFGQCWHPAGLYHRRLAFQLADGTARGRCLWTAPVSGRRLCAPLSGQPATLLAHRRAIPARHFAGIVMAALGNSGIGQFAVAP